MGFVQLAHVADDEEDQTLVSHCFVTVADMDNNTEPKQQEMKPTFADFWNSLKSDGNNMIGQKV